MKWLIASILVFILGLFNFFAPVRGGVQYIFNPIQFGIQQSAVNIKDWFSFYTNLKEIRKENLKLLEENQALRSKLVALNELEKENFLLREQLDIKIDDLSSKSIVLARAVGNLEDKTGTSVILDKGSKSGISESDIVVKGEYLLGIVRGVSNFRSEVELIISPNISFSVIDLRTNTEGIVSGQYGTSLVVDRVLPDEDVVLDDTFVTSGRDGIFPPGLIVGRVSEVSGDSAEVLKQVYLDILVDLDHLGKVFVLSTGDR